ncbi:hypothetical protein RhiJN_26734 [Ceratobasidium sp. AG-Ba]|nr:hypothetical protein RhiJN_12686 [Ceratobasidium sp. AG-Ba]QRV98715.1 hypothetical protein RhiJN_26734 [Ceratobasidium sp. AG-Ba]
MWSATSTSLIEQPRRSQLLTVARYVGTFALIAFLVIFNVILAGYEETTTLLPDPTIHPEQWWALKSLPPALRFRTKLGERQETTLPHDTALRTNSSLPLFPYYVISNFSTPDSQTEGSDHVNEPPYMAEHLDNCRVDNMELIMGPTVLAFSITASLSCDRVGDPLYI